MIFKSIGLFGRYQDVAVKATLNEIREHLEQRGRSVFLGDTTHQEIEGLRMGTVANRWQKRSISALSSGGTAQCCT